jgi:hypothetical protein
VDKGLRPSVGRIGITAKSNRFVLPQPQTGTLVSGENRPAPANRDDAAYPVEAMPVRSSDPGPARCSKHRHKLPYGAALAKKKG